CHRPSFFCFSSRRRHTRFSRDWSSDVCSSDLRELFDRLEAGRYFGAALAMLRQLEFALFDFRLHAEYDPERGARALEVLRQVREDRKSTRLNSSHVKISYAVCCLKTETNQSQQ